MNFKLFQVHHYISTLVILNGFTFPCCNCINSESPLGRQTRNTILDHKEGSFYLICNKDKDENYTVKCKLASRKKIHKKKDKSVEYKSNKSVKKLKEKEHSKSKYSKKLEKKQKKKESNDAIGDEFIKLIESFNKEMPEVEDIAAYTTKLFKFAEKRIKGRKGKNISKAKDIGKTLLEDIQHFRKILPRYFEVIQSINNEALREHEILNETYTTEKNSTHPSNAESAFTQVKNTEPESNLNISKYTPLSLELIREQLQNKRNNTITTNNNHILHKKLRKIKTKANFHRFNHDSKCITILSRNGSELSSAKYDINNIIKKLQLKRKEFDDKMTFKECMNTENNGLTSAQLQAIPFVDMQKPVPIDIDYFIDPNVKVQHATRKTLFSLTPSLFYADMTYHVKNMTATRSLKIDKTLQLQPSRSSMHFYYSVQSTADIKRKIDSTMRFSQSLNSRDQSLNDRDPTETSLLSNSGKENHNESIIIAPGSGKPTVINPINVYPGSNLTGNVSKSISSSDFQDEKNNGKTFTNIKHFAFATKSATDQLRISPTTSTKEYQLLSAYHSKASEGNLIDEVLSEMLDLKDIAPSTSSIQISIRNLLEATPALSISTNDNKEVSSSISHVLPTITTHVKGKNFLVRLKLSRKFNASLELLKSSERTYLKKKLQDTISNLYHDDESYNSCKVIKFSKVKSDNMTAVDVEFYFKDRDINHLDILQKQIATSHLGNMAVGQSILDISLVNDHITEIQWCLPPCINPYGCFPTCKDSCCESPKNSVQSSAIDNNPFYTVYNYIFTPDEKLRTVKNEELKMNKKNESSLVASDTGVYCNTICRNMCLPFCLPRCCKKNS